MTKKMQHRAKHWFGSRTSGVRMNTPTRKKSISSPVPLASQVSSFSEAQSTGSSTSSASSVPLVSSEQQPHSSEAEEASPTPQPVFDTTPVSAADITGPSSELLPLSPKECKEFSQQSLREHFLSVPPPPPPPGPPPQRKSKSRGTATSSASSATSSSSRPTTPGVATPASPPSTPIKDNLTSTALSPQQDYFSDHHHSHHPQHLQLQQLQQQQQQRDDCDNRIANQPPEVPEDETLTEMALRGTLEVVGPKSPSETSSSRRNTSWTDAVKALTSRDYDPAANQPESAAAASAHVEGQLRHQQPHAQPATTAADPALVQTWSESTTSTTTTAVAVNPSLDQHVTYTSQPPAPVDSPTSSTHRSRSGSRASSIATENSAPAKQPRGRMFKRNSFVLSESDILKSPAARNAVREKPRQSSSNSRAAASVSSAPSKLTLSSSPSRKPRDQEYEDELRDVVGELGTSLTSSVHPPPGEVQRKLERLRFLRERERRKHNMAMASAMAQGPPRMKTLADLAADSAFAAGDSGDEMIIQMVASAGSAGTDDDDSSNEDDEEYGSKFFGFEGDSNIMTEYTDRAPDVLPPLVAVSESPLSAGELPRPPKPPTRSMSAPTGGLTSFASRIASGTPSPTATTSPRTPPHQPSLPNLPTLAVDGSSPDDSRATELDVSPGYSMNRVALSRAQREFGRYSHSGKASPNPAEESSMTEGGEDDATVMKTPEQSVGSPWQHQGEQQPQQREATDDEHAKEMEKEADDTEGDEAEGGESTAEGEVAVEKEDAASEQEETKEAIGEGEAGVQGQSQQVQEDANDSCSAENTARDHGSGRQYQYRSTWMLPNGKPPLPRGGVPIPPQENSPSPHSSPAHGVRKSLSRSSSPARSREGDNEREKINPKGPMVLSPSMLRPASRSPSPQRVGGTDRPMSESKKGGPMVLSPAMLRPSNRNSLPKLPDTEEKKGPMVLSPAMLRPSSRGGRKELDGQGEERKGPVFGNPVTFGEASGEAGTGVTPRVADRAKAIEGWSGGRKSQPSPPPPYTLSPSPPPSSQRKVVDPQEESSSPSSQREIVESQEEVRLESPPLLERQKEEEETEENEGVAVAEPQPHAEPVPPMSPTAMEEWREQVVAKARSPVNHQVIDWAAAEETSDEHATLVEDGSLTWNDKMDLGAEDPILPSSGTLEPTDSEVVDDDTFESPKFVPEGWDEDQLPSDEVWPSHHPMARGHSTRTVQTGNGLVFERASWPAAVENKESFGEFDDKFFSMDDTFDSGSNAFSAGSSSQASDSFTPSKPTTSTARKLSISSPNDVMGRGLTPQRLRPPKFDTAAVYREAALVNSRDVSAWDPSKVMF